MEYYSYFNEQENRTEQVTKEPWCWEAIYNDGTSLKQFDDNGQFHRFAEIDQTRLHAFRMVSDDSPQSFALVFDPQTMKLIHFYRNTILEAGSENERRVKSYCFGYEKNIGGQTHKFLMLITGDELTITDDPDRVQIA